MATRVAYNPAWVRSLTNRTMSYEDVIVDTAATYKAGSFLRITSAGDIKLATTSAASGVGADAITHYALTTLDTATSNATTYKTYGVVHEDDIWEMNEHSTTLAAANIGQQYGINVTTSLCTVDVDITSHKVLTVVQPVSNIRPFQDDSADTLARVEVQILATAIYAARAA